MPGLVSHVERVWEHPSCRAFLVSLMALGRLIMFIVAVSGGRPGRVKPKCRSHGEDIGTVLRAAHTRRVVLFGASECGPAAIKFLRSMNPARGWHHSVRLIGQGLWAPDYPYALQASQYDAWAPGSSSANGVALPGIDTSPPSLSRDLQARAWWAGLLRAPPSPGGIWPCSRRCATPT